VYLTYSGTSFVRNPFELNQIKICSAIKKNGAVSKVNKKSISHLTRVKCTPSAAATVQVYRALPAVLPLMLTAGPVSKIASQHEKAFSALRFEVSRSVITVQREFCARFRTAVSAK
jgi:hypothetical protein